MNYLKISNRGLIVPEDLYLLGSSTKRGDSSMIGQFGTGAKYANVWCIRNDAHPRIFSAQEEIKVGLKTIQHREQDVSILTINDKDTSITSEMGYKWTGWMALREIICNAIDAGDHKIEVVWQPRLEGEDNRTVIFVPLANELSAVMANYEHYFSFERKPSFENQHAKFFIKSTQSKVNLYRKGVRCLDTTRESYVDIDLHEISIGEDRLAGEGSMDGRVRSAIIESVNKPLLIALLKSSYRDWLPRNTNDQLVKLLTELKELGYAFTCPGIIALEGDTRLLNQESQLLVLPTRWYQTLCEKGIIERDSKFDENAPDGFTPVNDIPAQIKHVRYFLGSFKMDKLHIVVGSFRNEYDTCKWAEDKVYLNVSKLEEIKFPDQAKEIAARIVASLPSLVIKEYME